MPANRQPLQPCHQTCSRGGIIRAHEQAVVHSGAPLAELLDVPPERAQQLWALWAALCRLILMQSACVTREKELAAR